MASLAQNVACAAMLVEGCYANTCLCNGIHKLVCFPWEPGGVIAACEMFPLTDLCIYGQFQQIRQLQSLYWDLQVEQSGVHPQLGVHLYYAHGGTCDLLSNTTPEGHDCDIMVGLLPWEPGMQRWPTKLESCTWMCRLLPASIQKGQMPQQIKIVPHLLLVANKTLSRDVKGFFS